MTVIREAEIVLNPIDRVSSVIDGIFSRLSRLTGEKIVPIDLDKKIFKNLDTTQDRLNQLGKKKVNVNITENSADVAKNVMVKFDDLQDAFSQPLHLTVIDQISRHLDAVGKQLDILRAKAIIPVGLSTGAAAAGLAAGVVGVAAVGGVAAAGIGLAAQSEEKMIRVNKLIGLTGEEAKNVSSDVDKLRIKTGTSESDVTTVYEMAGSSAIGLDKINKGKELADAGDAAGAAEQYRLAREEISGWAEQVLMAKVAFGSSSEEIAGAMSAIATSFKPAETSLLGFTKSLTSAIDYFADETPGKVSESGLMMAMQVASAGLQKIQPTDDQVSGYTALAASVMSVGKSGDHVGEVMRKVFITMQGDAKNIAKAMGMSMEEYQNLLDTDAQKILDLALEKYTTLKGQDAVEFAKLFGDAYGTEMFAAVAGSRDKFDAYIASKDKGGKAYEDASRIGTSFEGAKVGTLSQLSSIKESILVIGKAIGMIFLPTVNLLLTVVNKLLGPMALLADGFVKVADSIPGLGLAATVVSVLAMATGVRLLAPLLLQTATNLGIMTTATKVFTMYTNITTGAIKAMGTTLVKALAFSLANPIVLVVALAAAVGYLLYKTGYLQKAWDKFKDSAIGKDLIGGVIAGVAWVTDAFGSLFSWLDEKWAEMGDGVTGDLLGILDTVMGGFGWLFDKIDAAYESGALGKALKISLMGLFPIIALVKSLETLIGFAGKLLGSSNIVADVLSAGRKAWDTISSVLQWLYDTVKGTIAWLDETLDGISADATDWLKKLWDGIAGLAGSISDTIKGWLQDSVEGIPDTIVDWLKKLWDAITGLPSSISSAINGWLPWGSSEESGGSGPLGEQETINLVKGMKFDDGSSKFDFSDETFNAAYTEATTGTPQEHPNLANPDKYDRLVDKIADVIRNPSLYKNISSNDTGNGRVSPHETEVNRSEGKIDYDASRQKGIAVGLILEGSDAPPAEQMNFKSASQYAVGATFKKEGLFAGKVHEKEEIIPQAIAQKGTGPLSKVLGNIQQSDGGSSRRSVNINVEGLKVEVINPVVPDSGAAYQLSDVLRRQLEPFIESVVMRKVAQYIT